MIQGSGYADAWRVQDADRSFMHAMSSSSLDKLQACLMLNDFVSTQISEFRSFLEAGDQVGAYYFLGLGLHAIMDATSPVHIGFQKWRILDAWKHGSIWTSREGNNALTADVLLQTVQIMTNAVNGNTFDCSCYE